MTPTHLAIRQAHPADHIGIASLLRQLGYEASPALMLEKLEALHSSPTDSAFVAVTPHALVGCISLHALPLFHAQGCLGRITSMVVDERYRGHGIGTALITQAERWFDSLGCTKLEVTSADARSSAHRFYERHGFARDGQRLAKKRLNAHHQT